MMPQKEFEHIAELMPMPCVNAIIKNEWSESLLLKRKNPPMKGEWWVVGGIIRKGESIEEALKRKIEEETAFKNYRITRLIGVYSSVYKERHCIEINIAVDVSGRPVPQLNWEHSDYRWTMVARELTRPDWLHPFLAEWLLTPHPAVSLGHFYQKQGEAQTT
jgi:colanic acid biosynthesis protein WcaH